MSSTWSNLGLNLQGTGDNSGTWGQLTNVNLQDIDTAISGVAPITLTGNTTLAFTTNSSSTTFTNYPGLNKIIVLSGSLSATTVTVTVPNIQKDYVIVNNSGATVVVSSGGSTTISIPTSTNAYIYSNGSSSIFFALPLPTVTSAGGTTNQVQYNNAGAFAGSTNLTFNGTTLAIQTATALNLTTTSLTATNATVTTDNITTANITTANVTTANVTSLTATNATVTTDNITTANITTANVTTANVTSLTAVTATTTTENVGNINLISNGTLKIYNTANSQFTGLKVAAGAATSATFTLPSADGTANQVLQTNGSGVLSFSSPSAGSFVLLGSTSASNIASASLNGFFTSDYDVYKIYVLGTLSYTNNEQLCVQFATTGSYTVQTSSYTYNVVYTDSSGPDYLLGNSVSYIRINPGMSSIAGAQSNTEITLYNPNRGDQYKTMTYNFISQTGNITNQAAGAGGGLWQSITPITGLSFFCYSGNLNATSIKIYGVKNS